MPLDETTWCTTGPDCREDWKLEVCKKQVKRTSRRTGFKVLGVQLSFDNCFEAELQTRMSRTWRAFYKYKHLLCCKSAPLGRRLALLDTLVATSLFWCAASWNLTQKQTSKLRGLQSDMLHKMITLKRLPAEPDSDFMTRLNSKIKHLKAHHNVQNWDRRYYTLYYKWAAHVSRMAWYSKDRLTYRLLQHKSWEWIQRPAEANAGNQFHCRKF